jgi:amino acid adenylation domain-containing protein
MLMEDTHLGKSDMPIDEFCAELEKIKIKLWLDNGSLRYKAPKGVVTKELLKKIVERKAEIIAFLKTRQEEDILYSEITPVEKKKYYPLTAAQKRMFVVNRLDKDSTAYNTTLALKIVGSLDKERLADVFKKLTQRHESLRTTFEIIDGNPVQKIHDSVDFVIEESQIAQGDDIEAVIKEFVKPYDLSKLPLFRIKLVKQSAENGDGCYFLLFDIHHIISDGVSASIIIKEINALYAGQSLEPLKIQYKDYAAWHEKLLESGFIKSQKEFWIKQFSGELPVLNMPCDFQRPLNFNPEGESIHFQLGRQQTDKLNTLARENKVTLYTVLLTAYNILLSKYTGQDDIIIGTPVAGRIHEDTYNVVGIFLNTLPLRNFPKPDKTYRQFLKEVGKNCLRAFDNQDYPFDRLIEDLNIKRDTGRNPVFSAMFVMQNMDMDEVKGQGIKTSRYDVKSKMAQVDVTVNVTENQDGIDFELNYCTHLFRHDTMERFINHFANILTFTADNPDIALSQIEMLSDSEKRQVLYGFNNTRREYDTTATLHSLFEKQAAKTPDNIAVIIDDKEITYGDLNIKANKIAATLIKKGVKPDEIVGVLADPSIETVAAILGILKAGAAYVPINTGLPAERVSYILTDCASRFILTQKSFFDKIKLNVEILDIDDSSIYTGNGENPGKTCEPENLAYVIYTSGTTGKPKGVMIQHESISKTLQWRAGEYKLCADDCVLQLFSFSFDGSVAIFFTSLISGSKTVLMRKNGEKDPFMIAKEIVRNKVTYTACVPVLFSAVINCMKPEELQTLKTVILAGDKASAQLIKKCAEINPKLEIVNEYGPTESSVVSTIYRNLSEKTSTIIGKPIDNTEIYILDKAGMPQPVGVPGELCISGSRLAKGYLNRPDLTNRKFVKNPFVPGERLYKTGDLAKWMPDGNIMFIGRTDFQVKIRGYRIEPAEIEAELLKNDAVKEAVVIDRLDAAGNKYLCAYIVPERDFTVLELKNFLLLSLPEYMVPAKFVKMDKIPLTANGKVDRKALPEPDSSVDTGVEYVEPESEIEKKLSAVWKETLGLKNIGVNDNFFDIGGDSMSIINLHSKLDKVYPGILTVTDLFSYSTISKLAAYIESITGAQSNEDGESGVCNSGGSKDIAIIGISVNLPNAKNADELWNLIHNKVSCIRSMPQNRVEDADNVLKSRNHDISGREYEQIAYLDEIDKFDCGFFRITPKEANLMDPNQRLFLQTAWGAIEDAGYGGTKLRGTRTGVFVGFSGESEYGRYIAASDPKDYSVAAAGNLTSIIASRISYILDLKGPSILVNSACSSSLAAVYYACRAIQNGDCTMAIAGGVKIWLDPVKNEFQMGIESSDARTKTFDDSADGTAKGEGVAAVLLKPLDKALADNDSIYAVIKGGCVNQDGASNGITAPNPQAQADVLSRAWKNAGVNPETIGYIEAHGTGTKLGDPIEIDGMQKAFRKFTSKKQFCAVSSIKSNMGHLDNAAGIVSVVKAALALKNRELPPTINFTSPNRAIDFINSPVYVNDTARSWETDGSPRRCGVSAFGLSGTNCHLVLEEAPEQKRAAPNLSKFNVLTVSAKEKESFEQLISEYKKRFGENITKEESAELCYTLNTGRGQYNYRAAIIFDAETKNFAEMLERLENGIGSKLPENMFYGEHKVASTGNEIAGNVITQKQKDGLSRQANEILKKFTDEAQDDITLLKQVCELYVKGADVDWDMLYAGKNLKRIHAPVYPFLRKRCWFDAPSHTNRFSNGSVYYTLRWDRKQIAHKNENALSGKNVLLLLKSQNDFADFVSLLGKESNNLTTAVIESEFVKTDENNFVVDETQSGFDSLLKQLENKNIDTVIYLLSYSGENTADEPDTSGALNLVRLIKAIDKSLNNQIELLIVSDYVNEVTGREAKVNPENAITFGIGKSIGTEFYNIHCRMIDIDKATDAQTLLDEARYGSEDYQAAYRNGVRYVDVINKVDAQSIANYATDITTDGVYLVTGGTGRLGLEAAKYLASKGRVNIALINRTPVPQKDSWESILKAGDDKKACRIIATLREIESAGAHAECFSCDITDETALEKLLTDLRGRFGRINGIIHCAAVGVGRGGTPMTAETEYDFCEVLAPKVRGTWLLDKLTKQDNPDFFVMYSSSITLTAGYGSCSYTAANSYLDSFAAYRSAAGLRTLTIDWPTWENDELDGKLSEQKLLFKIISVKKAIAALDELLGKNISRAITGELNFDGEVPPMEGQLPFRLSEELRSMIVKKPAADTKTAKPEMSYDEPRDETERTIADLCAQVLGYEKIGIYDDFFELGGHSLLAVEFISKLGKAFKKNITLQDLFENPTVEKLSALFREQQEQKTGTEYEEIEF